MWDTSRLDVALSAVIYWASPQVSETGVVHSVTVSSPLFFRWRTLFSGKEVLRDEVQEKQFKIQLKNGWMKNSELDLNAGSLKCKN